MRTFVVTKTNGSTTTVVADSCRFEHGCAVFECTETHEKEFDNISSQIRAQRRSESWCTVSYTVLAVNNSQWTDIQEKTYDGTDYQRHSIIEAIT